MPILDMIARLQTSLQQMQDGRFDLDMIEDDLMAFLIRLEQHAINDPEPVFALLRRIRPVVVVKGYVLVTLHADVQDVLVHDQVFGVPYGPKMRVVTGGPDFFLGMANTADYERDVAHMRSVIRRTDIAESIVPFVATEAGRIVGGANGRLELVSQLTLPLPTRMICSYFGCVPDSVPDLAAWASTIFQYLFTDLTNDPTVDTAARAASAHVRDWLDRTIAGQKTKPTSSDSVLNRCLKLQTAGLPGMDDLSIRDNLLGILVGAIPTTSKCCVQALDELFKRPDMLAAAQQAAMANDDPTLARYVFEALRFHPNNPGVFRVTLGDYVVGKGTSHATNVPVGSTVLAATQSAMFDETVVDSPNEFRIDRPDYAYMFFGLGLHSCFGQYINRVQIPGILKPVLQRKNLRRAAGANGQLTMTGPYPSSLSVEFDPA
jgi:cytochrome P450